MEAIVNVFIALFKILVDTTVLGMPVLVWLILPAVILFALKFIQGVKK